MAPDVRLLKESLGYVEGRTDRLVLDFYAMLFRERPDLRELFPAAMDTQRDRFVGALLEVVQSMERPEFLKDYLTQLGRDHRKYGVHPEHYAAVGRALIGALRYHVGDAWTPAMEEEWRWTYQFAATTMIEAAEHDAGERPPWWAGEIVSRHRPAHDIAVITLRPSSVLPYTAGQHISVETARWPRVWRPYSVANAPSPDGLIQLHVRAVGAGWVSSALVYHTQVGDTVRLGPARGSMVVDHSSERPVLCVAGGTGLAPIKALTQEVVRSQPHRAVRVFFGTSRESELYDLDALYDLAARHPRLDVVPAVSNEATYSGERGTVSDVVLRYGAWTDHDVYVCGPPAMVRSVVNILNERGTPLYRIHYDEFGER